MRVKLLLFAQARERAGCAETVLELPDDARAGAVRDAAAAAFPALAPLAPHLAVAVDGVLARAGDPVSEGAEVALLPPVSGG